jgi:hypothetical protein
MVASIFIIQGYDTFRRPDRVAPAPGQLIRSPGDRAEHRGFVNAGEL